MGILQSPMYLLLYRYEAGAILILLTVLFTGLFAGLPAAGAVAFECGFEPSGSGVVPFCPKFWLVAILFLLFDVEVALLIPLSSTLLTRAVFLSVLMGGFVFEYSFGS